METLGQLRDRFTLELAQWIVAVNKLPGYKLRICEALRSDEQALIHSLGPVGRAGLVDFLMPRYPDLARRIANNTGSGILNSLHGDGLAADLQLFVDGVWITDGGSSQWLRVGRMWEQSGKDHASGIRFGDSNHISISYQGRK